MIKQFLFLATMVLFIFFTENKISQSNIFQNINIADYHTALYSDSHITEMAKIKDPKYEHISFEHTYREEDNSGQLASVIKAFKFFVYFHKDQSPNEEYGTWIWTPVLDMTPEYMSSIISESKQNGINVIYLSIDSYLDLIDVDEENEALFSENLDKFISLAEREGIKVDAEAGWRNWAEDGHIYKPFIVLNFVIEYNKNHANKFRGFQYDIEPYLLESYYQNEKLFLSNFVRLVDDTVSYLGGDDLKLSVVIPSFYDGKDGETPEFQYNGHEDYVLDHLFNILDRKEGSSIIIMSYRNFATGSDGSIEISKNEMRSSLWAGNTRVILAEETGEVAQSYMTFHNTSRQYFEEQSNKLRSAFIRYPNFSGLAIHYANAFLSLK